MMQNVASNPSRSSSILRSRTEKEEQEAQQILTGLFNEVDVWHMPWWQDRCRSHPNRR